MESSVKKMAFEKISVILEKLVENNSQANIEITEQPGAILPLFHNLSSQCCQVYTVHYRTRSLCSKGPSGSWSVYPYLESRRLLQGAP